VCELASCDCDRDAASKARNRTRANARAKAPELLQGRPGYGSVIATLGWGAGMSGRHWSGCARLPRGGGGKNQNRRTRFGRPTGRAAQGRALREPTRQDPGFAGPVLAGGAGSRAGSPTRCQGRGSRFFKKTVDKRP